jgi:hypothetical protein
MQIQLDGFGTGGEPNCFRSDEGDTFSAIRPPIPHADVFRIIISATGANKSLLRSHHLSIEEKPSFVPLKRKEF